MHVINFDFKKSNGGTIGSRRKASAKIEAPCWLLRRAAKRCGRRRQAGRQQTFTADNMAPRASSRWRDVSRARH